MKFLDNNVICFLHAYENAGCRQTIRAIDMATIGGAGSGRRFVFISGTTGLNRSFSRDPGMKSQ
jgi:hypothetical protein